MNVRGESCWANITKRVEADKRALNLTFNFGGPFSGPYSISPHSHTNVSALEYLSITHPSIFHMDTA